MDWVMWFYTGYLGFGIATYAVCCLVEWEYRKQHHRKFLRGHEILALSVIWPFTVGVTAIVMGLSWHEAYDKFTSQRRALGEISNLPIPAQDPARMQGLGSLPIPSKVAVRPVTNTVVNRTNYVRAKTGGVI